MNQSIPPIIIVHLVERTLATGGTVYLVIVDHGIEAVRARPVVEAVGEEVKEAA